MARPMQDCIVLFVRHIPPTISHRLIRETVLTIQTCSGRLAHPADRLSWEPRPAHDPCVILRARTCRALTHARIDNYQRKLDILNRGFGGYNTVWYDRRSYLTGPTSD